MPQISGTMLQVVFVFIYRSVMQCGMAHCALHSSAEGRREFKRSGMRLSSPARQVELFLGGTRSADAARPRGAGFLIESDRGEQLKDSLAQLSRLILLRPPSRQLPARSAARFPAAASGGRLA